jgi:cytoskeletal protein CcmA (bactofilin family)
MSHSSIIGAGTTVRGSVEGEGALEILGHVEGDVTMSGDVSIGEGASVLGNVSGARLTVQGAVKGDLRGTDAVVLESGARVVGDLSAPRIGIGAGALVRGNVRTESEPAVAVNKRTPAAAPFKAAVFAPKPVAKTEPKLSPPPAPEADETSDEDEDEDEDDVLPATPLPLRPKEKPVERRPPPPVLPSLGKGAKAKKKKGRDE